MKKKLKLIGGLAGSGIVLVLAFAGLGLVSAARMFIPLKRESDSSIT